MKIDQASSPAVRPETLTNCDNRFASLSVRLVKISILLAVIALVNACGRGQEDPPREPTPESTPTANAIIAHTPTPGESASTESEIASSGNVTTSEPLDTQPITTTDSAAATEVADLSSATVETHQSTCTQDIALDLAGHPQYSNLSQQMGCPEEGVSFEPVAINEFGSGPDYDRFMLWYSTDRQIYVLSPDGRWQVFVDSWTEEDEEIQCNPLGLAGTSPPIPRRGFGKLWCNNEAIRSAMGTIDREERLCQHSVTQKFQNGQMLGCFEDATIRYFQILADGTWDMVFVQ